MNTTEKIIALLLELPEAQRKKIMEKFTKLMKPNLSFIQFFTIVFEEPPKFDVTPRNTSIRTPFFTATITIPGTKLTFTGQGKSKKVAKENAGKNALKNKIKWMSAIAK